MAQEAFRFASTASHISHAGAIREAFQRGVSTKLEDVFLKPQLLIPVPSPRVASKRHKDWQGRILAELFKYSNAGLKPSTAIAMFCGKIGSEAASYFFTTAEHLVADQVAEKIGSLYTESFPTQA